MINRIEARAMILYGKTLELLTEGGESGVLPSKLWMGLMLEYGISRRFFDLYLILLESKGIIAWDGSKIVLAQQPFAGGIN